MRLILTHAGSSLSGDIIVQPCIRIVQTKIQNRGMLECILQSTMKQVSLRGAWILERSIGCHKQIHKMKLAWRLQQSATADATYEKTNISPASQFDKRFKFMLLKIKSYYANNTKPDFLVIKMVFQSERKNDFCCSISLYYCDGKHFLIISFEIIVHTLFFVSLCTFVFWFK